MYYTLRNWSDVWPYFAFVILNLKLLENLHEQGSD
jgi:hypothetical protein